MKPKKGALVYNWTLTFVVIGILAWAYLQVAAKYNEYEPLGTKQLSIFKTYAQGESALLYVDLSAKYSMQQAAYDLAKNAGSVDDAFAQLSDSEQIYYSNSCGKRLGANIWADLSDGKKNCFDSNLLNPNFIFYFDNSLSSYFSSYGQLRVNNYDYSLSNNLEITGKALNQIEFQIIKEENTNQAPPAVDIKLPSQNKNLKDFTLTDLCAQGYRCLLTTEAYLKLQTAQELANKKGVKLMVTEGFRDQKEINRLWEANAKKYPSTIERAKKFCNPANAEKCPHYTANAVDIFIKGKNKKTMTNTDWANLYEIMKSAGWVRYYDSKRPEVGEKWHFECCGTDRYTRAQAAGVTEII